MANNIYTNINHNNGEIKSQLNDSLNIDINMIESDINLNICEPLSTSIYIYANELGRGNNPNDSFCKYYSQQSPSMNAKDNFNMILFNASASRP